MLNLRQDPHDYAKTVLITLDKRIKRGRIAFITLNILSFFAALATASISAIIMSKLIINDFPIWFFFTTAGISAFVGFIGAIINFFVIDDNVKMNKRRKAFVEQEIIKYDNKLSKKYTTKNADYFLFTAVAAALQNKAAKKEDSHE